MRNRLKMFPALALALLVTQCNPGNFGLFPDYLTRVSNSNNLSAAFPKADGAKYFMNVLTAVSRMTEYVYVVQALPDGTRNLAILDGALGLVGAYAQPQAGDLHWRYDDFSHICGLAAVDIPATGAVTVTAGTADATGDFRDFQMIGMSGNPAGIFGTASFSGTSTIIDYYSINSVCVSPPALSITSRPLAVGIAGDYALEGVSNSGSSGYGVWIVLRERATDQGYACVLTGIPSDIIDSSFFFSMGTIVPGSVRFTPDGRPVVERLSGRLCRITDSGSEDLGIDGINLHDYIVAYGNNDAMYLFNPSSGQLIKTLAWWRN